MSNLDLLEGFEGIKRKNANIIFSILLLIIIYILVTK